jgi:hypothetical protein
MPCSENSNDGNVPAVGVYGENDEIETVPAVSGESIRKPASVTKLPVKMGQVLRPSRVLIQP